MFLILSLYIADQKTVPKKELKFTFRGKKLNLSVIADEEDLAGSRLKQQKRRV